MTALPSRQIFVLLALIIVAVSVLAGMKIVDAVWVERALEAILIFIGGHGVGHVVATKQQQDVVMGMRKRGEIITISPEDAVKRAQRLAVLGREREENQGGML